MLEAFWIPLLPPFFLGLLLSWVVECLLLPRPVAPWRRPWAANFTHLGVWLVAFALELALFRRPYFAVANVLAIQLVIVLVSRAKYQALQEPFVYPDFEYFTDAIKHPRLYLPFLGWWGALAAAGGYAVALWLGLAFERSITAGADIWWPSPDGPHQPSIFSPAAPLAPFYLAVAGSCIVGLLLARWAGGRPEASFDAEADLRRLGLSAALWVYGRAERAPVAPLLRASPFGLGGMKRAPRELPDLVCIQSESFFDVRRAFPIVRKDVLSNFDELCAESLAHGELEVAARGANTVRTEFAFLSGMNPEELGIHRYNPYRKLAAHGVPTLASYLKGLGYRTICVHPYYGSFYRRNTVLPELGFDEFIDLGSFEQAAKDGPYVGDKVLAEFVAAMLSDDQAQPLYVHVITMENHGPLHWETVGAADVASCLQGAMPDGCADLVAYVRHLRNADSMFGTVKETLSGHSRPAALCVFGDHIPIMPKVYAALGAAGGESDYVVWRNRAAPGGRAGKIKVQELAVYFLSLIGFEFEERRVGFPRDFATTTAQDMVD
ncbi:sulfatase-like hydrolase/transferase [Bordetella hinzii]|uniref:LTA synthase family protein n=1 Tax=Bordetella hinzii TaxID=103855 RepID=UPI002A189082|nr:sulfatase-like hydrolase/transferase [Bordetella hinzii]WPL82082.1 sulfatase-like hydrolase/transferase [Bordetella hinzii]